MFLRRARCFLGVSHAATERCCDTSEYIFTPFINVDFIAFPSPPLDAMIMLTNFKQ